MTNNTLWHVADALQTLAKDRLDDDWTDEVAIEFAKRAIDVYQVYLKKDQRKSPRQEAA